MTEAEKLTQYKQSERYRAYQSGLADWRERQEKMRQAETADVTEAERLKEYKKTAEYQARQEAYEAYRQGEWTEDVAQNDNSKFWRQQTNDWLQDKVNQFVAHPPSWLSVSYSSPEFSQ